MSDDAHNKIEDACATIWSQEYATHRPRLHVYAWRLTGDSAVAEDVVQNVILKILRLAPDPDSVVDRLSYLLRSVYNASMDWLKEQSRLKTVSIDDSNNTELQNMVAPERDADVDAETDECRLEIAIVMRRLNKRERTLLALFLEGYDCSEIAAQLAEDKRVISYDLNAVRTKVRSQLPQHLRQTRRQDGRRKKER